jgi:ribonucleoside-diphosphate reductase alpha chain
MTYRFETDIARHIWETKYRYVERGEIVDRDIEATWSRIAGSLAEVEKVDRDGWEARFFEALRGFRFLPGGRIQAGAGTHRDVTLFNCFVMGRIEDSMDGIFESVKEGALTMQAGGGVGYDFSTLRPMGSRARHSGNIASGPVSFMRIWDATCGTVLSTGARRGAMMATLRCDHPDIERFVDAKRDPHELRHFNCSVLATDAFMQATYDYAEPGVVFIDRINAQNNLRYCEEICATNPCGEVPLPAYGACDLGSINLVPFVVEPFADGARLDLDGIAELVPTAVRMLDNVIDVSRYPIDAQREQALANRRIGLGFTGLADALAMLGLRYDSTAARAEAGRVMRTIRDAAYRASIALAREKAPFPNFDAARFLDAPGPAGLPGDLHAAVAQYGIRNSHLTAIAPTGTISLLAENVSSGVEPAYALRYLRKVLNADGDWVEHEVEDYAHRLWRRQHGSEDLPATLITASKLHPKDHLQMQAAVQPYVDHAVSKTINVPENFPFEDFESVYQEAYRMGLKGCTTFRPNPVTGAVLSEEHSGGGAAGESGPGEGLHQERCTIERECD